MNDVKLGCHVGMAGKEMFLASAKKTIPPYKKRDRMAKEIE